MKSDENKTQPINYLCTVDTNNPYIHLIGDTSVYKHKDADVIFFDSYLLQRCHHHNHVQGLADNADIFFILVYFFFLLRNTIFF